MLVFIFCATVFLFHHLFVKPLKYWKQRGIPQNNPAWMFGDFKDLIFQKLSWPEFIKKIYDSFPGERYIGTYEMMTPRLMIRDPDLIKQICIKDFDHFTDHITINNEEVDVFWAKNLFASTGQKWKDIRHILSPVFTSSKIKTMFCLMDEYVQYFCQYLKEKNQEVLNVEFKDLFSRLTNDIIATTIFGIKVDSLALPNNEFYLMGREATDLSGWKSLKFVLDLLLPQLSRVKFLTIKMFSDRVHKYFAESIKQTIKLREEHLVVRPDLIQLMVESRKGNQVKERESFPAEDSNTRSDRGSSSKLSDDDIAAHAMVFFFAGFDTTSTLMAFMAYELAIHTDIQEKLRNEIKTSWDLCEGKISYDVLMKMKYLDMVVSESLRKWPPMLQMDRQCTKPYVIGSNPSTGKPILLEKGTRLHFPYFAIHRDPNFYPDPEKFDPDRFGDDRKHLIKPGTFLPFGLGPRNCIGSRFAIIETKILFFYMLKYFEIVPVTKTDIPVRISKKSVILLTENGMHLGLKRIDNN